jgi:hypothetical protein
LSLAAGFVAPGLGVPDAKDGSGQVKGKEWG